MNQGLSWTWCLCEVWTEGDLLFTYHKTGLHIPPKWKRKLIVLPKKYGGELSEALLGSRENLIGSTMVREVNLVKAP